MAPRSWSLLALVPVLAALATGCIQSPSLTDPEVFVGKFPSNVNFQPFLNTSPANVTPDATVCYPDTSIYCPDGGATLRVDVPSPGDPENFFAGGAIVSGLPRNLSGYDAVTFWAKSTRGAPVLVGIGADQTDDPAYITLGAASLSTEWRQYVLPIPLPSRLTAERGLFYFSAGADGSPATGFTFWLADIQYVTLGPAIGGPHPVMPATCIGKRVGDVAFPAFRAGSIPVRFDVDAGVGVIDASSRYFTFTSSDPAVASVDPGGIVSVMGDGTATITAQLGGVQAAGPLTVNVGGASTCPPLAVPTTIAPTPEVPAANVISLFGSAYTPRPVSSWHTSWSDCCSREVQNTTVGTHPVKKFVLFPFNGVAISPDGSSAGAVDASAMTWFHVDVWTPDGYAFEVKLVNDPAGSASESTVGAYITQTGSWVGLEIPMTAFRNLGGTSKIGQMLFLVPDGTSSTWYVDNVYFHN
jgi:Bacterial Ig-like domain (group 2)